MPSSFKRILAACIDTLYILAVLTINPAAAKGEGFGISSAQRLLIVLDGIKIDDERLLACHSIQSFSVQWYLGFFNILALSALHCIQGEFSNLLLNIS